MAAKEATEVVSMEVDKHNNSYYEVLVPDKKKIIPVGSRISANIWGGYFDGVVAEVPATRNRNMYLVVFENGFVQYISLESVDLVASSHNSEGESSFEYCYPNRFLKNTARKSTALKPQVPTEDEDIRNQFVYPPQSGTEKEAKLKIKEKARELTHAKPKALKIGRSPGYTSRYGTRAAVRARTESVHLRCEEKITVVAKRDGGLDALKVHGIVTLKISDEKFGCIKIKIDNKDEKGVQSRTHPYIDKELFRTSQVIAMKNRSKPFPVNVDVSVLKWHFQSQDESFVPLLINCWPSENGTGDCNVNIDYELQMDYLELNDVKIQIPLMGTPVVTEYEGKYNHNTRKKCLVWKLKVIDSSNKTGSMEFSCSGKASDFFPITVEFESVSTFCNIKVADVVTVDNEPVKFDTKYLFVTEKFEII